MAKSAEKPAGHVDQTAREQIRKDWSRNAVIVAGAGTGKTTELTRRVVNMLVSGRVRPENLLIATFTEKAAAEMQERTLDALAAAGSEELVRGMEEHPAGTFHSRARALLEAFSSEAGLPPGFGVLDEQQEQDLFSKCFRVYFSGVIEDGGKHGATLASLASLGVRFHRMEQAAFVYAKARGRNPALSPAEALGPWSESSDLSGDLKAIVARAKEAVSAAAGRGVKPGLLECARRLEEAVAFAESETVLRALALKATVDDLAELLSVADLLSGLGNSMRGKDPITASLKEAIGAADGKKNMYSGMRGLLVRLQDLMLVPCVRDMMDFFEGCYVAFREEKRRRAVLAFDDLLVRLRDLVKNDSSVRKALARRFAQVLVDEFQDTDPLQLEIMELIALAPERRGREGAMFLVGDPRQSIYHFRNADLRTCDAIRRRISEAGGVGLSLSQNFRSSPYILNYVNALFETWKTAPPWGGGGEASLSGMAYSYDLAAARQASEGSGVDILVPHDFSSLEPSLTTGPALEVEARAVARHLKDLYDSKFPVYDKDADKRRPFRWSDAAILLQRMTHASPYENALEDAGIPCFLEGAQTFFAKVEVRSLGALLRAVVEPRDAAAVMAALASPVLSVPVGEVLAAHSAGWPLSLLEDLPDVAGGTLKRAVAYLRRFLPLAPRGLTRLVEAFLAAGGLGAVFSASDPSGAKNWSLDAFAELIRAEEAAGKAPADILDRFFSSEGAAVDLPAAAGLDAVRIMTIHKAKGLEWPVVVVADLLQKPGGSGRQETRYIGTPDGRFAIDMPTGAKAIQGGKLRLATPLWEGLEQSEEQYEYGEWLRKFYVAFTRARDRLILAACAPFLVSSHKDEAVQSAVDRIVSVARESEGARVVEADVETAVPAPGPLLKQVLSAVEAIDTAPPPVYEAAAPSGGLNKVAHQAALLGEAFHAAAAYWFRTGVRPKGASFAMPGVDAEAIDALLDNLDRLDIPQRVSRVRARLVEWPLAVPGRELRPDLLLLEDAGWTIVEFKSDRVSAAQVEDAVSAHRAQIAEYAAVLRGMHLPVSGALLVLAALPRAVSIAV